MKKKTTIRAKGPVEPKSKAPLEVSVSIAEDGSVTVNPDCLAVTGSNRKIRWVLDDASKKNWRLSGFCWCGETEPPGGEFHDWNKKKATITVTDRNDMEGTWRYGLLYKEKGKGKDSQPRVFDPTITNQPPRYQ
jgi:hypothetical protein